MVSPAMIRQLDEQGWSELTHLLRQVEHHMAWPDLVALAKVALLPKPLGGERPICLLPLLYRIWARIRRKEVASWDGDKRGEWDYAAPGRSAMQAAAEAAWEQELIRWERGHLSTMLVDAEKFYDHTG